MSGAGGDGQTEMDRKEEDRPPRHAIKRWERRRRKMTPDPPAVVGRKHLLEVFE